MAISTLGPTSGDDFFSAAAFPGFVPFSHPGPSPPDTSEGSPDSSLERVSEAIIQDDEQDDDDGEYDSLDRSGSKKGRVSSSASAAKRTKVNSAERRATHNAIERARRESLNGRFIELANALPTMANVKRPSKSVIVNKSLEWIHDSQIREHALVCENNALLAELNELRARLHLPPRSPPAPLSLASDYARFKANAPTPLTAPTVPHPLMIAHPTSMPDNCFFRNSALGALGAKHHPNQFAAFGATGVPTPPPSAPANLMAFPIPFNQQAFATAGMTEEVAQQPASTIAKCEGGGDTGAFLRPGSDDANGDPGVHFNHKSTLPSSVAPASSDSLAMSDAAATQAGALEVLHGWNQQHLHVLAASQQQQTQSGCGTPGLTAAPSMSAAGLGAGAQYLF